MSYGDVAAVVRIAELTFFSTGIADTIELPFESVVKSAAGRVAKERIGDRLGEALSPHL